MKYLSQFYKKIAAIREERRLTVEDIAVFSDVDPSVARAWEFEDESIRCFPTLDNMIDLCLKLGISLEQLIDTEATVFDRQPELPGLRFIDESDLTDSLDVLQSEMEKLIPSEQELELLRRFRRSDEESRQLIIQLMNK